MRCFIIITILGKRWNLLFVKPEKLPPHENPKLETQAICDWDKPTETKTIRISEELKNRELLDALVHEMLHAADYYKDEEWVATVGSDIARALWRLGWRRVDLGDK